MRGLSRLSALAVGRAKEPSLFPDGGGLYLQVSRAGTKSWVFRYRLNGRERLMGLGPLHTVSLSEAREAATECRKQTRSGIDPIDARVAERDRLRLDAARAIKFKDAAASYIKAHQAAWQNEKHALQWTATLTAYAYPVFGKLPVACVDTALILKAIEPIWSDKPETASRVRGRIEAVLDWATARGYRQGDNPARWRGHLDKLLPARSRVRRVEHHAALPYPQLGRFMTSLREQKGVGARALEFAILTAARTGEVIGAQWSEIDLPGKLWTVPADRMKGRREHRVPLSDAAAELVRELTKTRAGDFVFPGGKPSKPMSNMALLATLRRMNRQDLTTHGFRSTFRDWAAEQTDAPSEVAEMALAHTVSDKVEAAYRRGDLFDKRADLMTAWAVFCATAPQPPKGAD